MEDNGESKFRGELHELGECGGLPFPRAIFVVQTNLANGYDPACIFSDKFYFHVHFKRGGFDDELRVEPEARPDIRILIGQLERFHIALMLQSRFQDDYILRLTD